MAEACSSNLHRVEGAWSVELISASIFTERPGQIVEGKTVASEATCIVVNHDDVVIRNCHLTHGGINACGIANERPIERLLIEECTIENAAAPPSGPALSANQINVCLRNVAGLAIRGMTVRRGSSGVYLRRCHHVVAAGLHGEDFRGPAPRGQLIQFDNCHEILLDRFSCRNGESSWPEDVVSVFECTGSILIERGLLDGCNCPTGWGVMIEHTPDAIVRGVDCLRMGNGNFAAAGARSVAVLFDSCRARDSIAKNQGRGIPTSNCLGFGSINGATRTAFRSIVYWNLGNPTNIAWDRSTMRDFEFRMLDFSPSPAAFLLK